MNKIQVKIKFKKFQMGKVNKNKFINKSIKKKRKKEAKCLIRN